jgi:HK97 gp10 family phage protein
MAQIQGFREIDQILGALGKSMGAKVVRKAIRDGAKPLLKEAKANASHADVTGNLSLSLGFQTDKEGGYSEVMGPRRGRGKNAKGWHAHLVEYGTAPHLIKPKKGTMLKIGGRLVKEAMHPGSKAQPFLRPAWDAKNQIVVQQVGTELRKILESNFKGVFK